MAEFEKDQYVLVQEVGRVRGEKTDLLVGVWQYKDFPPKVRVHVVGERKSGVEYLSPLASFGRADLEAILPLLHEGLALLGEST